MLTSAELEALTSVERRLVIAKRTLPGAAVCRLMRANNKTTRGLAQQMDITQARVREVREGGLNRALFIKDWVEAITRSGAAS